MGKLQTGDKVQFVNQQVMKFDKSNTTAIGYINDKMITDMHPLHQHYFLSNSSEHMLKLNYNGMTRAKSDSKLGVQKQFLVPKSLKNMI